MTGGSLRSSGRAYDIHTESDVIELLKAVRHSTLDLETKDEIRDLIFALRSNETPEQLEQLNNYLEGQPFGVTTDAASDTPEAAATTTPIQTTTPAPARAGFAGRRPAPTFGKTAPTKPTAQPAPTTETSTAPTPAAEPATAPQPASSVASTTEPQTKPVTPSEPAPQPTPASGETDTPASPASETSGAEASTPPKATDATPNTDPGARIIEIKQDINARVGNPVNLIDATNEVGRTYMNALLEAMKATNGGGDTVTAMQQLETAYQAVLTTLDSDTPPAQPTATQATANPESDTLAAANHTTEAKTATTSKATPTAAPQKPATPSAPASEPEPQPQSVSEPAQQPEPEPAATASVETPPRVPKPAAVDTTESITPTAGTSPIQSVAAAAASAAAKQPEQQPEPQPAEPADPLMTETVTEGLQQLLSEWKLFKSGGLLGTGAKGVDHPLFKELRNVPMNLVIAGRFEGATPEVKQSIHDYMNGWRYEQGMTHDLQETFEHYLRRVVKTIIDKQAKAQ